jgi:isorenieratene synthase
VRIEYLAFNFLVLIPVLVLSARKATFFLHRWGAAWTAVAAAALPFLIWDALATGRHWTFNPRFITGLWLGPLPIEEVLFFFTMPFACLFSWHTLFGAEVDTPRRSLKGVPLAFGALGLLGPWVQATQGLEYTALVLLALGGGALLDAVAGSRVLERPGFLKLLGFVVVTTTVFNGYLTARPVVLYDVRYQLGVRLFTIPLEDYGFGVALVLLAGVVYQLRLTATAGKPGWLARRIEARLGGYRQFLVRSDPAKPLTAAALPRVAVIGSGIAGLTAASVLAERGFSTVVYERDAHLGGKVGSWPLRLSDGTTAGVSHGFHAFFRQYYNLTRWLRTTGAERFLAPVDDCLILAQQGDALSFKGVAKTPGLNLISLIQHGFFTLREALLQPKLHRLEPMLRYDASSTFARFDTVPFATFAEQAGLPPRLRLAFSTFARAFFAEGDRLSTAEVIKGFHFYCLSNNQGLLYDYLNGDFQRTLLTPVRQYLEARGARIELDAEVSSLERSEAGGWLVRGEAFEEVILAADVKGTRALVEASASMRAESPDFVERLRSLRPSQRRAALRVWLDRDVRSGIPVFLRTDRRVLLDAVSVIHRAETESAQWVAQHGGGVFELHSYAIPDELTDPAEIRRQLWEEFVFFFPEIEGATVRHEHSSIRDDFSAFHVGLWANRPPVETPLRGLSLAGDWVKLPVPAMLMEASCTAGLLAANRVLEACGLRAEPVETVPSRGLLWGLPERPS